MVFFKLSNILTWLRGFQDELLYLVFSLYPSLLGIEGQKKLNKSAILFQDLPHKSTFETSARIILSELVTRSDNVSSDSVKTVNKKLKTFCNQNNWKLVQHQNITINDLNQSGLHLNNRGNNILFNNFVNCLDNRSA